MKNNKGFTLIEVIISLAIVTIVTLSIFSFFRFNLNSFNMSTEAMEKQSNLRITSYKLTNELRNIGFVDLDNYAMSDISSMITSDSFIFVDSNSLKKGNYNSITNFADDEITNIEFSLREEKGRFFLNVEVFSGIDSYKTEILLNNIITDNTDDDGNLIQMDNYDIDNGTFSSIQYNYSNPPMEYYTTINEPNTGDEDYELTLKHPPSLTLKKNQKFKYTAQAEGGTAPYFYEIDYDSSQTDEPYPTINGDTIEWDPPNEVDKKLVFTITITDSNINPVTSIISFEITTIN